MPTDYYTNLNDGKKAEETDILRMLYAGVGNYNRNKCNKATNTAEFYQSYKSVKSKPTREQLKMIEHLNNICRENGLEEILVNNTTRGIISKKINNKIFELRELGIQYQMEDKIRCKDCKYFNANIGSAGTCRKIKRPKMSHHSCVMAERRNNND